MTNARVYVLPLANLLQVSSVYVSYMNVIKCLDAVLAAMISPCSFQKHFSYVISQTFALDCLLFFFAVLEFLLSHNLDSFKLFSFIPQPLPFATTFFDHPIETTRTTTTMKKKKKLDPKWELSILNFQNLFCPFFFYYCR